MRIPFKRIPEVFNLGKNGATKPAGVTVEPANDETVRLGALNVKGGETAGLALHVPLEDVPDLIEALQQLHP